MQIRKEAREMFLSQNHAIKLTITMLHTGTNETYVSCHGKASLQKGTLGTSSL